MNIVKGESQPPSFMLYNVLCREMSYLTDSHTEVQRIYLAKLKVHCPNAAVHSAIEPLHNKSVESHSASIIHKLPAPDI